MAKNMGILGVKYGSTEPYNQCKGLDFIVDRC